MKKLLIVSIIAYISMLQSKSQTFSIDFSFSVYYETTSTDSLVYDSLCNRICKIVFEDISDIAKIHVQVGTDEDLDDIFYHVFDFDVTTGLPAGFAYSRINNEVYLTLLQTYKTDTYFYHVWVEDSLGNVSIIRKWN